MNKEELIKEIKKSRKQNTNERYEYINSHFNQTNYAISLEKYVKELLKENKELHNKIDKAIDLYKNCKAEDYCTLDLDMYNALIGGDVDDNG